jgi:D-amino peptidase
MRLYLSVDMEGVAGIGHPAQTTFGPTVDRVDYDRSRTLMAGEANAAIEAAFAAGATEVVVNDSHWTMRNLRADELDARARLIIGDKALSMTEGIGMPGDGAFDGAIFVGYHAGAGHPDGVIAHTYSGSIQEVRVNGVPHNEAGLNAIRLGHHGVPVILVAGDDALADEVEGLLPWAERVVVKRGLGYATADSLSPESARAAIREGLGRAIDRIGEMRLHQPAAPISGEIDFRLPVHAAYAAVLPEAARLGARTVGFVADDGETFYRRCLALLRLAAATTA